MFYTCVNNLIQSKTTENFLRLWHIYNIGHTLMFYCLCIIKTPFCGYYDRWDKGDDRNSK